MRKALSIVLSIAIFVTIIPCIAIADGSTWHCDICDADRDGNFCYVCGAQRPAAETANWTCPTCGTALSAEYIYCPNDGTEKAITSNSWPRKSMIGTNTSLRRLKKDSDRHQSFFGPGKQYPGAGAYKPHKATSVTAFFTEGDYVYVDLIYPSVGRRCLYFSKSSLSGVTVEEFDSLAYPAKTTNDIQPLYGPDTKYDKVCETTKSGKTVSVIIPANTDIFVFFESNSWVFAEFSSHIGMIRAWLPSKFVKPISGEAKRITNALAQNSAIGSSSTKSNTNKQANESSNASYTKECSCGGTIITTETDSYMPYDEQYHYYEKVTEETCQSCGEQHFYGGDNMQLKPHSFVNGVCEFCGFISNSSKHCSKCGGDMISVEFYHDIPIDESYHKMDHYMYYECRNCGNRTEEQLIGSEKEGHTFDANDECVLCHYIIGD